MKSLLGALLLTVIVVDVARAIDTEPPLPDPQQQARYEALIHELRCLQCRSQSLADSDVSLAADLRREVRGLIAQGKTDDEVKDFLTARYGDYVLFRPPLNARTWVVWFAPAILLLAGGLIAWRVVRHRSALVPGDADEVESAEDPR
ncbi:MAG TPA: cytochrome c-type biogenesis protein [Steroidobacteraceae bacterium]|nr:cytochrome c-type biogenesis protein [Steroidobacteraceae bacterium]